jgi:hypothetical protein
MGFCNVEYLRILWGILPCCEQLRGGSGWGQEVKKCIIVHVEGGFWQKVHYNALFGDGKRQEKFSMQSRTPKCQDREQGPRKKI